MSAEPKSVSQFQIAASELDALYDLGFDKPEIYTIVAPRRTLDRRIKNNELLTLAESDRVQRLQRVMDLALRVFKNDEKANRWLRKPNRGMNNAVPIALLESETGAYEIEKMLGAIQHGMFS